MHGQAERFASPAHQLQVQVCPLSLFLILTHILGPGATTFSSICCPQLTGASPQRPPRTFPKTSPNPLRTRRPETPASSSEGRAMELGPQSQPTAALPTWPALFSVLPYFRGVHPEHTVCGSVPQPGHREGGFMSPRCCPLLLRSHCPRAPGVYT